MLHTCNHRYRCGNNCLIIPNAEAEGPSLPSPGRSFRRYPELTSLAQRNSTPIGPFMLEKTPTAGEGKIGVFWDCSGIVIDRMSDGLPTHTAEKHWHGNAASGRYRTENKNGSNPLASSSQFREDYVCVFVVLLTVDTVRFPSSCPLSKGTVDHFQRWTIGLAVQLEDPTNKSPSNSGML